MSRARTFVAGGLFIFALAVGCRHTQPQTPTDNSVAANHSPAELPEQRLSLNGTAEPLVPTSPPELVRTRPDPIDVLPTAPQALAAASTPDPMATVERS